MRITWKSTLSKSASFTYYILFYAALAFMMPFVVLYYQQLGFSGAQIGLLAGITPLVTLVGSTFWTAAADATRRHRLMMSANTAIVILLVLLFPLLTSLGPITLLVIVYAFFAAPIASFADSATLHMLGSEKAQYGRLRLGGTIGWGLAAPLAGLLIQAYGLRLAFWGYAALMFLTLLISQAFVYGQAAERPALRSGLRTLLANQRWVLFLLMAFVSGIGLASINTYLLPYMQELHASQSLMGVALGLATLSELPVLFLAERLLKRLKPHGLMVFGMLVIALRLLLYAAVSTPAGVLIFQIVNGPTFATVWVASVSYADASAPPGLKATSQGLFAAVIFGFGAAIGGLLGGLLLQAIGGRGMYLVIGLLVLVCLGGFIWVERRLPD